MMIKYARTTPRAKVPVYHSDDASGMDLYTTETIVIPPGEAEVFPTGIKVAIPSGYEGQVRSRSGMVAKYGVAVANAPGTIDADYRGEIKVILRNYSRAAYTVYESDRIAQLVIAPVTRAELVQTDTDGLGDTERGEGGLGSTGV